MSRLQQATAGTGDLPAVSAAPHAVGGALEYNVAMHDESAQAGLGRVGMLT